MNAAWTWMFGLALALALAAPAAAQETKVVTVPGEVIYTNAQRPGDPGNCSAVAFVRWADVPGTISARAIYTRQGAEASEFRAAPFDDTYQLVATYTVQPGFHWIAVSRGWSDGPRPNDCSVTREKLKTIVGPPARVELTVPAVDAKACNAAKRNLTAQKKAVKRLQKQLKRASGKKAKKRTRAKLKKAKARRTKAAARVQRDC